MTDTKRNYFKLFLVIVLSSIFIYKVIYNTITTSSELTDKSKSLTINSSAKQNESDARNSQIDSNKLYIIFHQDCRHCHHAIEFIEGSKELFPTVQKINITTTDGMKFVKQAVINLVIPSSKLAVPLFIYNNQYIVGFKSGEKGERKLLDFIKISGTKNITKLISDRPIEAREEFISENLNSEQIVDTIGKSNKVEIPYWGELDPGDYSHGSYSLFVLTLILALADGFNPCAMWVLIYLISLISALRDRRKIIILVGSFLLASGVLYFLFMTAWLNMFVLIGYQPILTLAIALSAVGFGINNIYEAILSKGEVVCKIDSLDNKFINKAKTKSQIQTIISSPINIVNILGIITLAFTVNSIEFVCSSALPAIYTHTLTLIDMPRLYYYLYILLYVLIFMLDDLMIFGLAIFALNKVVDTKYAYISKIMGSIILIFLGLWLLYR